MSERLAIKVMCKNETQCKDKFVKSGRVFIGSLRLPLPNCINLLLQC